MIQRPSRRLGETWVGVNYWSRGGGPRMWARFDEAMVTEELRILAEHDLGVTRSFCYLPDFMPRPYTIDTGCLDRFVRFLDLSQEAGLRTIPTFVVGHMSGANWDVWWRGGRDLYGDGWMLAQQCFLIREVVSRTKDHPAVAGWLLSNEMPLYGGETRAELGRAWAELLIQAIRAAGGRQPASTGDGAWGLETTGHDNGFRLSDLAPTVDFVGPHVYQRHTDLVRQHLSAAFVCELCHLGRPVVLEEFGLSSDFASDQHAADYYRQILHTSLLAGAVGWLGWNNTDFDLPDQDPYRHHPFEQHFGLHRADGTPKPALHELQRFARLLRSAGFDRCVRTPTGTAILVPTYWDSPQDFPMDGRDRASTLATLQQEYAAARLAGLRPSPARERERLPDARLWLAGSQQRLLASTWQTLEERAAGGSVVYLSYHPFAWHPGLNERFGVEHRLRYWMQEPFEEDELRLRFVVPFGDVQEGETLSFPAPADQATRVRLPLETTSARVIATDQRGRPALVERGAGAGAMVLLTSPVELWSAGRARTNPDATARLFRALAARAGALPEIRTDRLDVVVDELRRDDGTGLVWLVSEAPVPLDVPLLAPAQARFTDVESGAAVGRELHLDPYQVRVLAATR